MSSEPANFELTGTASANSAPCAPPNTPSNGPLGTPQSAPSNVPLDTLPNSQPDPELEAWQSHIVGLIAKMDLDEVMTKIVNITVNISTSDTNNSKKQFTYEELLKKFQELGGSPNDLVMKMLGEI